MQGYHWKMSAGCSGIKVSEHLNVIAVYENLESAKTWNWQNKYFFHKLGNLDKLVNIELFTIRIVVRLKRHSIKKGVVT